MDTAFEIERDIEADLALFLILFHPLEMLCPTLSQGITNIATAVTNGIVNGVGDGKFGVGTNITRQDMAVLIERVLNFKNIEVEKAEVEPFADAASVADYAQNAVTNMKAIGLIKGYDNNYNPKDNLTRAEAVKVISLVMKMK